VAMLEDVRAAMRISEGTTAFDGELTDLIAAARADLQLSGVSEAKAEDDTDPLIKRAITVYVKWQFGFDNPDVDRLERAYTMLKAHLTLSQDYISGEV
jgi:uncharacterized phage protein (predicted DNA packaging)